VGDPVVRERDEKIEGGTDPSQVYLNFPCVSFEFLGHVEPIRLPDMVERAYFSWRSNRISNHRTRDKATNALHESRLFAAEG